MRKALLTCDVIDYHCYSGVTDVAGNQTPEALLAGCVPQLQPHLEMRTSSREGRGRRREKVSRHEAHTSTGHQGLG